MKVALGVSGGIAAYKAAELVRLLQERDLEVQVVMTRGAQEFITPLTFAALSGRKVITEMFATRGAEPNVESAIEHIAVAQSIDLLLVAPATADVLSKLAHGIADDFLTTLYLATKAPVVVAPSMNVNMWENPATRHNIELLRDRGVRVVEPESGYLACGMSGAGRLAAVETISSAVFETLGLRDDLKHETILITAGPTEEPLDAVRFISNRSSGKMGYALAQASRRRGARVILVSGPTQLAAPDGITAHHVHTADEMAQATLRQLEHATVILMAAAVADFRPAEVHARKIKRQNGIERIKLERTRDILAEISAHRSPDQLVVGFAAETDHLAENATAKLHSKRLDLIVANDVTQEGAGFEVDTNIVTLVFPDDRQKQLPLMAKLDVADRILDEIVELRKARQLAVRS
jgi:phosphopantothenoylcysteine decarboxylase / phosphopantothenate---cysteine ligase